MFRFFRTLLLVLVCSAGLAAALLIGLSSEPFYSAQELISFGRYSSCDELIDEAAKKTGVDPALLKAVVWRESAFHPDKVGTSGERGLMQVGEAAATDWSRAKKIETFVPTDLFEPRTNLEAGTWYLKRALDKWKAKDDPVPFALAEYNAGAGRLDRWIAASGVGAKADSRDLLNAMDFPGTRRYVEEISARAKFYRNRGGR
ncbi:MAG: lytic transglycosylase domain-containing protein [Chthoniobacteraceae bacterium]